MLLQWFVFKKAINSLILCNLLPVFFGAILEGDLNLILESFPMILILVLYALFASAFTLGKDALSIVPPIFFIAVRMILAGGLLLLFIALFDRKQIRISRAELPWFMGIIAFHIYGAYVAEYVGMQYITSGKACLLYNMSPFMTALLSYLFFNERLNWMKFLGLSIGFAAFIPALQHEAEGLNIFATFSWPELLLLLSVLFSCIGWIFMKKLTHHHKHSYLFVNTVGMLIGGIWALITSAIFETCPSFSSLATNGVFLRALFGLILVSNIICYNLYGYLLHRYSPTLLSFFGCVAPLFGALFGWVFLGEMVDQSFWITMIVSGIGLYLYYREDLKLKAIDLLK